MAGGDLVYARDLPLITRHSRVVPGIGALASAAEAALLPEGGEFVSGWVLGVALDEAPPAAVDLISAVEDGIVGPFGDGFSFSFMKAARGNAPSEAEGVHYEGPHLDSHPALVDGNDLLRLLVNLSPHPRRFVYALTDRWTLASSGMALGLTEFEPLSLPDEVESQIVEIPGRDGDRVSFLEFWASAVPHFGLNDAHGYFLASFESVRAARV